MDVLYLSRSKAGRLNQPARNFNYLKLFTLQTIHGPCVKILVHRSYK